VTCDIAEAISWYGSLGCRNAIERDGCVGVRNNRREIFRTAGKRGASEWRQL